MHEEGSDKGLIGDENGFLLLTPVGTSKGRNNCLYKENT